MDGEGGWRLHPTTQIIQICLSDTIGGQPPEIYRLRGPAKTSGPAMSPAHHQHHETTFCEKHNNNI